MEGEGGGGDGGGDVVEDGGGCLDAWINFQIAFLS